MARSKYKLIVSSYGNKITNKQMPSATSTPDSAISAFPYVGARPCSYRVRGSIALGQYVSCGFPPQLLLGCRCWLVGPRTNSIDTKSLGALSGHDATKMCIGLYDPNYDHIHTCRHLAHSLFSLSPSLSCSLPIYVYTCMNMYVYICIDIYIYIYMSGI